MTTEGVEAERVPTIWLICRGNKFSGYYVVAAYRNKAEALHRADFLAFDEASGMDAEVLQEVGEPDHHYFRMSNSYDYVSVIPKHLL